MENKDILPIVRAQLAVDLNCSPEDFDRDGFVFCTARENPGRRPFPREKRHFDMLTMGSAVIVSATADILPWLREQLRGKSRDEAFEMPFVRGHSVDFVPDRLCPLPLPENFACAFTERPEIPSLYALDGFHNALSYDERHPRPDVLAVTAMHNGSIAGMAGASADCEMLWQIGIDVLPQYRKRGIAAALTSMLAAEILRRGKIPYYGTASSNVASQGVAHKAGFRPAWACAWRGIFDGETTNPTG